MTKRMMNLDRLQNVNYYLNKCQILIDYLNGEPPHIEATQEMLDELVEGGFLDEFGLTERGHEAARVIEMCFELSDQLMDLFAKK